MADTFQVLLETVSPVHIGNGEKLSPYTDYVYDDNDGTVYIFDPIKIEKALSELDNSDEAIDEFVEMVMAKGRSNQQKYSLKNFFSTWNINYKSLAAFTIKTDANIKTEEIHQLIKSGNRPYIPGSSIKGAIRTALLYHHRKEEGYTISQALNDLNKRNRNRSPNGEDLFGKGGEDVFKFLHISDTSFLSPNDIGIVKTVRYHLRKQKTGISITKEVIPENKRLSFRLQVKATPQMKLDKRFSYFYKENGFTGEKKILQIVNQFTKQILDFELEYLNKYVPHLKQLIAFYQRLKDAAESFERKGNGAVLRIGSGKTFYDNTIVHLFDENDSLRLIRQTYRNSTEPFPIERAVIDRGNVYESTMGWVYLYDERTIGKEKG
ncbi:type III-A CRISPR-associated RAMP protein Csm5 [Fervidibacillus albus]|uniref:CRISPR system Cms protein Csm5 n=1 Tax=Fervidibacillus albus TaxID=2980026 RepID=A0A9E8LV13_9BACI|nr:type III-A CRISPR-associated RAMP protein Csm5 [Fervidibacillus albus]WAA09845.1 type III-A CRISPR-associated RAMP protein Csm5 [Fervidibacillus albus]